MGNEEQKKQASHFNLSNPARRASAIVPHDDDDLAEPTRALYVGVSGDIDVIMADGSQPVLFKSVPVGVLPIQCGRVKATLTTATDIIGLY